MSVIVIGSVNVDVVTYAARAPRPGESLTGDRYAMVLGGKGSNQAIATARLGADVRYIGRVGQDTFGRFIRDRLTDAGMPLDHVSIDPVRATGIAVIGIDGRGENAITVIPGANSGLGIAEVDAAAADFKGARVLLAQLETPLDASLRAAELARAAGATIVLDPAPIPPEPLPRAVFGLVDVMTPNEIETEALTGIAPKDADSARAAAERLISFGLSTAVVKMGGRGVYAKGADLDLFVPPFAVTVVDTVAAGDCFNGGLAYALSEGRSMAEAVRFAAACGALACTRAGSADAAPTREEAEALLGQG